MSVSYSKHSPQCNRPILDRSTNSFTIFTKPGQAFISRKGGSLGQSKRRQVYLTHVINRVADYGVV